MSRIGNYDTALKVFGFKALKKVWNDFEDFENEVEQCKKIVGMENHLSKEQIDKLKKSKQNKVINGSLIKKGKDVRDSKV